MNEYILNGEIFRETIEKGYYITSKGSVAKIKFDNGELTYFIRLKGEVSTFGHIRVELNRKKYLVHRLVFQCYSEEDLKEGFVIDHIDANPSNNDISNLRQVTQKENIANATRHGNFGRNGCRKILVYDEITKEEREFPSVREFLIHINAPKYMIEHNSISALKKRREYNRYHVTRIYEH